MSGQTRLKIAVFAPTGEPRATGGEGKGFVRCANLFRVGCVSVRVCPGCAGGDVPGAVGLTSSIGRDNREGHGSRTAAASAARVRQ